MLSKVALGALLGEISTSLRSVLKHNNTDVEITLLQHTVWLDASWTCAMIGCQEVSPKKFTGRELSAHTQKLRLCSLEICLFQGLESCCNIITMFESVCFDSARQVSCPKVFSFVHFARCLSCVVQKFEQL